MPLNTFSNTDVQCVWHRLHAYVGTQLTSSPGHVVEWVNETANSVYVFFVRCSYLKRVWFKLMNLFVPCVSSASNSLCFAKQHGVARNRFNDL